MKTPVWVAVLVVTAVVSAWVGRATAPQAGRFQAVSVAPDEDGHPFAAVIDTRTGRTVDWYSHGMIRNRIQPNVSYP